MIFQYLFKFFLVLKYILITVNEIDIFNIKSLKMVKGE